MKRVCVSAYTNRGFTMIEIVVVLVVLFIVSAVVVSRYTTSGVNELMVETDALKSSLRYAHIQSLNQDGDTITPRTWGIHFPNDTSYILYKNGAPAGVMIPVKDPDPAKDPPPKDTHSLQGNVRITSGVGTTVTFNRWGSPIDGSGNPLTAATSITLQRSTENSAITITRNTGFIP